MQTVPSSLEYLPLAHTSHKTLPSVLDQPAGQAAHTCVPLLSNVPGLHARVVLQMPSSLQLIAVQPLEMATQEDPPAAINPGSGLLQLVFPSFS